MNNKQRAARALKAVHAYPANDPGDLNSSIVDLITDLLQFAEQKDLSIDDTLRVARGHYEAEGGIQ